MKSENFALLFHRRTQFGANVNKPINLIFYAYEEYQNINIVKKSQSEIEQKLVIGHYEANNSKLYLVLAKYRKLPLVSPGLIKVVLDGLINKGAYIQGGYYNRNKNPFRNEL